MCWLSLCHMNFRLCEFSIIYICCHFQQFRTISIIKKNSVRLVYFTQTLMLA